MDGAIRGLAAQAPQQQRPTPDDRYGVHPPVPGMMPQTVPTPMSMTGGAVMPKPPQEGALEGLLGYFRNKLQMNPADAVPPTPPMPGQNPAQGIVDAVSNIMSPVKRGMDYLQSFGR